MTAEERAGTVYAVHTYSGVPDWVAIRDGVIFAIRAAEAAARREAAERCVAIATMDRWSHPALIRHEIASDIREEFGLAAAPAAGEAGGNG
jgi:hypothetical protein